MYEAIEYFEDLQDGRHAYNVGDTFPREGKEVDSARILALLSTNNKRGRAVIRKVAAPAEAVVEQETPVVAESEAVVTEEPIEEVVPKKRSRKNK